MKLYEHNGKKFIIHEDVLYVEAEPVDLIKQLDGNKILDNYKPKTRKIVPAGRKSQMMDDIKKGMGAKEFMSKYDVTVSSWYGYKKKLNQSDERPARVTKSIYDPLPGEENEDI